MFTYIIGLTGKILKYSDLQTGLDPQKNGIITLSFSLHSGSFSKIHTLISCR